MTDRRFLALARFRARPRGGEPDPTPWAPVAGWRSVALWALLWAGIPPPTVTAQPVGLGRLVAVPVASDFPDAVAPNALRWACADDLPRLARLFAREGRPLDPSLVRTTGNGLCHIFYEPTIEGFRSDSSQQPVAELLFNVDTLSFLSGRSYRAGDVLDVSKQILSRAPGPLTASIGVEILHREESYERATEAHYRDGAQRPGLRSLPGGRSFPWVQDYVKSGTAAGAKRILVPRRIFEGTPAFGDEFKPLLDSFADPRVVRSKLSWDGGDLQFVARPGRPDRLVMLHGASARPYWGRSLSDGEYSYVLRVEFGADEVIALPDIPGHVDYMTAFLPGVNVALVSEVLTGDQELARAAARILRERFAGSLPEELLALDRLLDLTSAEFEKRKREVLESLRRVRESGTPWTPLARGDVAERLSRLADLACRHSPGDCLSREARERLLDSDLPLLADWVQAGLEHEDDALLPRVLLTVIESQLPGYRPRSVKTLNALARSLERIGFRVIRVPRIAGDPELKVPWGGISYTNGLVLDRSVFLPQFGFGPAEDRFFEDLRKRLPPGFEVIPVYARRLLLVNGGLHCVTGIVYGPDRAPPAVRPGSS